MAEITDQLQNPKSLISCLVEYLHFGGGHFSYQLSVISYQLLVISYQLSVIST
ncbi:MAG: hypothetical protein F6K39_39445, partial [Okeania sp. SIO3B3]|nr:hypothetical protein [Okeania sp. SIO3B3]